MREKEAPAVRGFTPQVSTGQRLVAAGSLQPQEAQSPTSCRGRAIYLVLNNAKASL